MSTPVTDRGLRICQHPRSERYFLGAWTEKCAICKAVRFVKEPYEHNPDHWPATTEKWPWAV